ncbi:MAG: bifunctional hydroxymethylpyrimidine kinase/phosphomethylpyrimidine kinase, partial [Nitrospiraceae bacterium]|nr:bifunctional hydroxymethylpyrimidine kinase/phosphomethylpyrimidine kinase [Nitrospiraceae bacterium]
MADTIPRVLTIAGSDSGGGAGIQADLKTYTALGVYGMTALTSITAQNTIGVTTVHNLPPEFVAEQIDVVLSDIGADVVKTGMLSNAGIIEAVAQRLAAHAISKIVLDPVMVATSGDPLLQTSARDALAHTLLPLALLVTPNVPEAEVLSGISIANTEDLRLAARAIHELGPQYVLMKGGHLESPDATDLLFDGARFHEYTAPRIGTPNTHGTGCTYASAIAAYLAKGDDIPNAVAHA